MARREPVYESPSIMLRPKVWDNHRIELELSSSVVDQLRTAEEGAAELDPRPALFSYGLVVMTANGKMSQWSGKWANSMVPPERPGSAKPKVSAESAARGENSNLSLGEDIP